MLTGDEKEFLRGGTPRVCALEAAALVNLVQRAQQEDPDYEVDRLKLARIQQGGPQFWVPGWLRLEAERRPKGVICPPDGETCNTRGIS